MMRHLNPRAIERARARDLVAIKSQLADLHRHASITDDQLGTVERDVDRLNEIDPDELADREYVIDVRYDLEDKIDAVKNTVSTLSEGPPPDRAADPDRVADVERQLSDLREDLHHLTDGPVEGKLSDLGRDLSHVMVEVDMLKGIKRTNTSVGDIVKNRIERLDIQLSNVERQLSDLREDLSQSRAEVGAHDSLLDDIADWMRTHNFLS